MQELKLNPDRTLNILGTENKTYAMVFESFISKKCSYLLNVFDEIRNVHYFSKFEINSFNEIEFSEPPFCRDKYLQYSIYKALKLLSSAYNISMWEFDSQQEFIEWYKANQKIFNDGN